MRILRYVTLGILIYFFQWDSSVLAQTTRYFPFPQSDAFWRVTEYDYSYPGGVEISDYQIYFVGDTLYNGNLFSILNIKIEHAINHPWSYGYGERRFGYLWQDTTQKIVYFKDIFSLTCNTCDSVLYNFNLEVGDSVINLNCFMQTGLYNYIHSIDSVLIGSDYRKKYTLENASHQLTGVEIIEGIGSTLGGFYQYDMFEQYFRLNCFQQTGVVLFNTPNYTCAELVTNIIESQDEAEKISIYPNPSNGDINIQSLLPIKEIRISTISGVELKQILICGGEERTAINLTSTLTSGLYIIYFLTEKNVYVKNIIIY